MDFQIKLKFNKLYLHHACNDWRYMLRFQYLRRLSMVQLRNQVRHPDSHWLLSGDGHT